MLEVKIDIAKLREAIASASIVHQRSVRKQQQADAALKLAYAAHADIVYSAHADLRTVMLERSRITAESKRSLERSRSAKKALEDHEAREEKRETPK